jgi:hypothetical protein
VVLALPYANSRASAVIDGVQTMIEGVPTLAGWLQYLEGVFFFGACGACGGLFFWFSLRIMSSNRSFKQLPYRGTT